MTRQTDRMTTKLSQQNLTSLWTRICIWTSLSTGKLSIPITMWSKRYGCQCYHHSHQCDDLQTMRRIPKERTLFQMCSTRTHLSRLSYSQQTEKQWIFQQSRPCSTKQQLSICSTQQQSILKCTWYNQETQTTRDQQDDPHPHHRRTRGDVPNSRDRWWRERTKGKGFYLRRAELMTVSPTLNFHHTCSTIHGLIDNKLLKVPVTLIYSDRTSRILKVDNKALIDSGSEGKFVDQNYARSLGIKQMALDEPIKVLNVDGTRKKRGTIMHLIC